MNKKALKFNGVYDKRTVRFLNEKGVNDFSLDFRPYSLNFIQSHLAQTIVKEFPLCRFYLQFCNEKDFVIRKIIDDLSLYISIENMILEFHDHQEKSFYDSLGVPFQFVVDHEEKISSPVLSSQSLSSIVIDGKFLQAMHDRGQLQSNIRSLYNAIGPKSFDLPMILQSDWDLDLFPSIAEFFDFDKVSYPINGKVEVCFRNVDLVKVSKELMHVKYGAI